TKVNWYPPKIPDRFNQCTIRVRMVQRPPHVNYVPNNSWSGTPDGIRGIETTILDLVAEFANIRMYYHYDPVPENWGNVYDNGTITGNLNYLYQEIDDIAIGAYAKTMRRSLFFDDVPYQRDGLVFCVPFKTLNLRLKSLAEIMGLGVLVLTLFLYLVVTTMSWLVSRHDYTHYQKFDTCVIDTYQILLGLSVSLQPRSTRIVVGTFMGYHPGTLKVMVLVVP
ncbi:uncharacterized protein LOC123008371, partial [Tribolium madens]